VLALAVSPRQDENAESKRPARWVAVAWTLLWLSGAVLQLLPGRDTNASISMSLTMNATSAPAWLAAIDNHLSALVPYQGVSIAADLVVLQVFAGFGVLMARRMRLAAVTLGIGLSLVYWVVGQNLGQVWSGISTDPGTGPLTVLLGVTVLGSSPWRHPESEMVPAGYQKAATGDVHASRERHQIPGHRDAVQQRR